MARILERYEMRLEHRDVKSPPVHPYIAFRTCPPFWLWKFCDISNSSGKYWTQYHPCCSCNW